MSSQADRMRKDGNLSFEGGQDAGRSPSVIARNQVALATNTSMRGGFLGPRPAFVKCTYTASDSDVETAFKDGRFQHAAFFDGSGTPMLLSSHGGRLFRLDLTSNRLTEITPTKSRITTTTAQFIVPALNATVAVAVVTTDYMTPSVASNQSVSDVTLTIAGIPFRLMSVNSATGITVQSTVAAAVGMTIAMSSDVAFTYLDTNSQRQTIGWSVQAENYWIYQDNQSAPVIFNGSVARRANAAIKEVPVGNVMAYAMGRLIVALPDRMSFRVGDIVFGSSGTAANGYRDAILTFSENDFLNEGGDFVARVYGAPSGYGNITCIKPISMMDTQLGQGPVMVGTPNVVFTLNLPFDRNTWKDVANPLQTVTPISGPTGQDSTVNVNTDLWYRSANDGIHSFIQARRDFVSWGNSPQSSELGATLGYDTSWLLEYASGVVFDNRLLMTCSPVPSSHGVWHRGLVSLDFNLVSSLRGRLPPAWEGIWSKLRVLKIVTGIVNGKNHCYIYCLNNAEEIEVWTIDPDATEDDNESRIVWSANLPSYNCGDGFALKYLETGDLFVDDVKGQVDITVKYRSDQNPCWQPWDTFCFCATNTTTDVANICSTVLTTYREQFRSKLRFHQPLDTFDTINGRKYRTGYEFQPRLEITGHCRVKQMRVLAYDDYESILGSRTLICPPNALGNPDENWAFGDPYTEQVFGWE